MSKTYRLELKPEQDGMGYFYGTLTIGDDHYRVDVLPPKSHPRPFFVSNDAAKHMHDTEWIVHVDGEEIARVTRRDDIESAVVQALPRP